MYIEYINLAELLHSSRISIHSHSYSLPPPFMRNQNPR